MSKNKQHLWLLWIMLLYFGIAIGGFFIVFAIKTALTPKQTTTIVPTPIISTTPQITPPIGWHTYTNSKNNLSFLYPPNHTAKTESFGTGISMITIEHNNIDRFQILIVPKTLAKAIGQDFDTYYAMPEKTTINISSPLAKEPTKAQFIKGNNRTVHSYKAFAYRSQGAEIGMFMQAGDSVILVSTEEKNKKELEQLVETLVY